MARAPRTPPKPKPVATDANAGISYEIAKHYREISVGEDGGVMRVEPGDYVVMNDGALCVMPPARFAEAFPDLAS